MGIPIDPKSKVSIKYLRCEGFKISPNHCQDLHNYLRLNTTKAFLNELSTEQGILGSGKNGLIQLSRSAGIPADLDN